MYAKSPLEKLPTFLSLSPRLQLWGWQRERVEGASEFAWKRLRLKNRLSAVQINMLPIRANAPWITLLSFSLARVRTQRQQLKRFNALIQLFFVWPKGFFSQPTFATDDSLHSHTHMRSTSGYIFATKRKERHWFLYETIENWPEFAFPRLKQNLIGVHVLESEYIFESKYLRARAPISKYLLCARLTINQFTAPVRICVQLASTILCLCVITIASPKGFLNY